MSHNKKDLLDLPHFHEEGYPYMSQTDRAAQFSAYKALDGFEEEIFRATWNFQNQNSKNH